MSSEVLSGLPEELAHVQVDVPRYTTKVFLLADSVYSTRAPEQPGDASPSVLTLQQNYPNPFNAATSIRYHLPHSGRVLLQVYDMLGRVAATLADGRQGMGEHQVMFDGQDVASGLYFISLHWGREKVIKKMILAK